MQELDKLEIDAVSGGWAVALFQAIASNLVYDALKAGAQYAMANSYMGRGEFPSEPRAGHE
jgi:hypothetical protein